MDGCNIFSILFPFSSFGGKNFYFDMCCDNLIKFLCMTSLLYNIKYQCFFKILKSDCYNVSNKHLKRDVVINGRINWPIITNRLAMTQTLLADLSQFFFILSDLKCYRSAFSSSANHLSIAEHEGQPKKSTKENMFFSNCKTCLFSFVFIFTSLTFKPHNF